MSNRKESIAIHLGAEQLAALNELSKESRVPRAAIIRLAIDGYLERVASQRAVRGRGHDDTSDRADE